MVAAGLRVQLDRAVSPFLTFIALNVRGIVPGRYETGLLALFFDEIRWFFLLDMINVQMYI
jgi:hypothetical protein